MKKIDEFKDSNDWVNWVGLDLTKHSGKPFKSGEKVGKAIGMGINEHSGKEAFKMDDESIVDCYQVKLVGNNKDIPLQHGC